MDPRIWANAIVNEHLTRLSGFYKVTNVADLFMHDPNTFYHITVQVGVWSDKWNIECEAISL